MTPIGSFSLPEDISGPRRPTKIVRPSKCSFRREDTSLDIRIKDSSRKKLDKTPWVQNYGEDVFGVDEWWSSLIIKYWTLIHEINPEVSCIYISDKWVLCISIRLSSHHKANHFLRVGPVTIKRIRRKKLLGMLLWKKYSFSMDST